MIFCPKQTTLSVCRYKDWKLIIGDSYPQGDGNYVKPAENQVLPTLEGDTCLREVEGKTVIRCLFNLKCRFLLQEGFCCCDGYCVWNIFSS